MGCTFNNSACGALAMVLLLMTSQSCLKSLDSASFVFFYSNFSHMTSSAFHISRLSTVQVTRLFVSHLSGDVGHTTDYLRFHSCYCFLAARVRYLTRWVASS